LPDAGTEVHFDAARLFVKDGLMPELLQIEIGAEFTIDARKKVQIESGGDTDRIVVSGNQSLNGLQHIGAEKQRITGLKNWAQIAEEIRAGGAIEVADVAPEEKNHQMLARCAAGGGFTQPVEIFAFEADNADAVDVAKLAAEGGERSGGNFNGMVPGGLPAGERFQKQAGFAARAAAEFGDDNGTRKLVHNFPCVQLKQGLLGPREAIFGKGADYLEER